LLVYWHRFYWYFTVY